jgi:hypothetical protein
MRNICEYFGYALAWGVAFGGIYAALVVFMLAR